MDARQLLDALVGASSKPGQPGGEQGNFLKDAFEAFGRREGPAGKVGQVLDQATGGLREMAQRANESTGGIGTKVDRAIGQAAQQATGGQSPQDLAQTAKDFMNRHPGLAEAALMSVAGLMLGTRRGRGVATNLAGLGGLALISGLAYKAFQNYQSGKPLLDAAGQGGGQIGQGAGTAALPGPAGFDPASANDDDALLFVRAMVAAASADGHLDPGERMRITSGLSQAGIDAEATRWLERELGDPASVEEIADRVETPEKAAQVYAAARVAIDPDTMQEREFLRQLAEALDLDPQLRTHIDDAASGIKVTG
jgi:uncharacterized membrane protein YebE (DUF533 family)